MLFSAPLPTVGLALGLVCCPVAAWAAEPLSAQPPVRWTDHLTPEVTMEADFCLVDDSAGTTSAFDLSTVALGMELRAGACPQRSPRGCRGFPNRILSNPSLTHPAKPGVRGLGWKHPLRVRVSRPGRTAVGRRCPSPRPCPPAPRPAPVHSRRLQPTPGPVHAAHPRRRLHHVATPPKSLVIIVAKIYTL